MRQLYILFLLVLPVSCIREVEMDTDQIPKQLVVNCFFTEGQAFMVDVSRLAAYPDTTDRAQTNVTVKIFADGNLLGQLPHTGNGLYSNKNIVPQRGKAYSVEVSVPGYPTATATDSLPAKVPIRGIELRRNAGVYDDGLTYDEIAVAFKDTIGANYYGLMNYDYGTYSQKWWPSHMFSSDPAIVAEGISLSDYPEFLIFNDEIFTGQEYKLRFNVGDCCDYDYINSIIYLETYTYSGYHYKKRLLKHKPYTYQDPFEPYEPVPLYTNIQNGLGIFAGYMRSSRKVVTEN